MAPLHLLPSDLERLAQGWSERSIDLSALIPSLVPGASGGLEPDARAPAAALLATWRRLVADLAQRCEEHAAALRATSREQALTDDAVARGLRGLEERLERLGTSR